LENGYSVVGNVVSTGGDTFALGGDSIAGGGTGDGSFELSQVGIGAQFRGFDAYAKTGTSTWALTGNNTAVAWDVSAGKLQVDGSTGNITVDGGALSGIGTVAAITLNTGGAIAPGHSPGTLHGTDLTWNGGAAIDFQLGATSSTADTDLLALVGTLTRGSAGTYPFHFSDGNGAPTLGTTYTLMTFGSRSGFTAADFTFDYTGANTAINGAFTLTSLALQFTISAAPVQLQSFEVD
jgi:hypothetical protein